MANVKISGLTAASAVAAANEFEINEAGVSKKVTGTQIKTFVQSDLGSALYAYNSRSDFATAILSAPLSGVADGTVVAAGGHQYIKSTGATTLPSLSNWLPLQPFDAEQWGIVWDGSTDQTTNLNAAFSYVSTQGGGHINIPKKSSAIAINGSLVLEENVIANFNSTRVDGATPCVLYTAVGAKLIWSRGAQLHNYWAEPAAGVAATYTGPFIQVEQGGADANILAPIVGSNIYLFADSTGQGLANGFSSTEKVTWANIDNLHGENLNALIYAAPSTGNWFNSNIFTNIMGTNNHHTIYADSTNGQVAGCRFHGAVQSEANHMKRGFMGVGGGIQENEVDIFWWDTNTLAPQDGEVSVCIIEWGNSNCHGNLVRKSPGSQFIIDRAQGSGYNHATDAIDSSIIGYIPPNGARNDQVTDFNNPNNFAAADAQNIHWDVFSSTVSSGNVANVFLTNDSGGSCNFTAAGTDEWKYVGCQNLDTAETVFKGLYASFATTVPLEVQFWYSNLASPTYSQLEGAEGSITDFTKLSDVYRENYQTVYVKKGQTTITAQHYVVRFKVPASSTVAIENFAIVLPDAPYRRFVDTNGADMCGTLKMTAGTLLEWQSSNLAGSANARVSNSNVLELVAAGGVANGALGPKWIAGTGSPEGAVSAGVGSFYSRTDGGTGTTFYVKESGTSTTGWVAK